MTQTLYRYRILLLLIGLVAVALVAGLVLYRSSTYKVPSRGVFVLDRQPVPTGYRAALSYPEGAWGGIG
jgi:hypothetical protein